MTVANLIASLQNYNPSAIVIMAKDAEGNAHSPLSGCWEGSYRAETTWYGEVGLKTLTDSDVADGYSEEDVVDGEDAVVLCPVN